MYDMINIFEVFLPQLLRYPNPSDPLNGEAAAMLMREPKSYEAKVKGMSCPMTYIIGLTNRGRQSMLPNTPAKMPWMTLAKKPSLKVN